ncbi:pre-toxin TG domain-containing protein [Paludifilum halophilum]|uniref:Pre-toxin TG domain-containing protein n=1 Tax=Paludifilum halophilum TaxID=1642702 RepID=A0A235B375_9BACL|nr:pre-toxin TG domain-containing protein [Paludifilum halophilum]OYD06723.1 hypothetical protein CHM34_14185 [Paludifilum halophilum]
MILLRFFNKFFHVFRSKNGSPAIEYVTVIAAGLALAMILNTVLHDWSIQQTLRDKVAEVINGTAEGTNSNQEKPQDKEPKREDIFSDLSTDPDDISTTPQTLKQDSSDRDDVQPTGSDGPKKDSPFLSSFLDDIGLGETGKEIVSMIGDAIPFVSNAKSLYEARTGVDPATGESLNGIWYGLSVVGIVPVIGNFGKWGKLIAKGGPKLFKGIGDFFRGAAQGAKSLFRSPGPAPAGGPEDPGGSMWDDIKDAWDSMWNAKGKGNGGGSGGNNKKKSGPGKKTSVTFGKPIEYVHQGKKVKLRVDAEPDGNKIQIQAGGGKNSEIDIRIEPDEPLEPQIPKKMRKKLGKGKTQELIKNLEKAVKYVKEFQ